MPHTTFDVGAVRQYVRRDAPNHNRPWSLGDEDELLRMFALGEPIDRLASFFGRTTGAINGRLARLLGIAWPDTPNAYRASGRPIRRRGQRMPRPTTSDPVPAVPAEWPRELRADPAAVQSAQIQVAQIQPLAPPAAEPGFFERAFLNAFDQQTSRLHRPRRQRRAVVTRVEASAPPPQEETPERLHPVLVLSRKHYEALAAEIKALRPPFEGKVAAAQNSTLNRMAYRMAKLFEGEDSNFDRAKWLAACGVTSTQEGN